MGFFSKKTLDFDMVTTKGGDGGKTALYSGEFIFKNDIHFTVLGEVDELSSNLGLLRHADLEPDSRRNLRVVQQCLYRLMSVVATQPQNRELYSSLQAIQEADIVQLEHWQKHLLDSTEIQSGFVIPGDGSLASAQLDVARTVARRCERSMVDFIVREGSRQENAPDLYLCQRYLNRLSDYLFVLARHADQRKA